MKAPYTFVPCKTSQHIISVPNCLSEHSIAKNLKTPQFVFKNYLIFKQGSWKAVFYFKEQKKWFVRTVPNRPFSSISGTWVINFLGMHGVPACGWVLIQVVELQLNQIVFKIIIWPLGPRNFISNSLNWSN